MTGVRGGARGYGVRARGYAQELLVLECCFPVVVATEYDHQIKAAWADLILVLLTLCCCCCLPWLPGIEPVHKN